MCKYSKEGQIRSKEVCDNFVFLMSCSTVQPSGSADKYKLVIYFHLAALPQLEILLTKIKSEARGRDDTSEIFVHREYNAFELAGPREDLVSLSCALGVFSPVKEIM